MNKKKALLILLFFLPTIASYAFGIPETTITRTHLMKDIEQSSVTVGVGMEFVSEDPDPIYMADFLFGYLGYSPTNWLEFGIALHTAWITPFPSVEAKIDLVDIFSDANRISCLLLGGIGGLKEDEEFYPIYHGGVAVNLRLNEEVQLYGGAGSDSLSKALSVQTGLYFELLEWLGVSLNIKLVTGPEGFEPMLSVAPLAFF